MFNRSLAPIALSIALIGCEPVSPIIAQQQVRLPLSATKEDSTLTIYLSADDLSDGREQDYVIWQQPRFEFKTDAAGRTHPPILLRDIPGLIGQVQEIIDRELPRTTGYLEALAKLPDSEKSLEEIAEQDKLNPLLLKQWSQFVGIGRLVVQRGRIRPGHAVNHLPSTIFIRPQFVANKTR